MIQKKTRLNKLFYSIIFLSVKLEMLVSADILEFQQHNGKGDFRHE